jgi:hypothetical protein
MKNENEILDKTYTSSENSYFNKDGLNLQILLPLNDEQNPYSFIAYDISQFVDGQQQNALFIYMKKQTDDASDLSGYDDDKCECGCILNYDDAIQLKSNPGFRPFDPAADNTLVIVYHDSSDEKNYQQGCAEEVFVNVPAFVIAVAANGNFQTDLNLMGTGPKKAGMSSFPKR